MKIQLTYCLDSSFKMVPFIQAKSKSDDVVVYAYFEQILLKNVYDYIDYTYVEMKLLQQPEYLYIIFL